MGQGAGVLSGGPMAERLMGELRVLAGVHFAGERAGHTLQPTAVVSELWIRLATGSKKHFDSEASFRAWASTVMRHLLIDHARKRRTLKRRVDRERTLTDHEAPGGLDGVDLLALDEALRHLSASQPRLARVVEMRYFGGMTDAQIGTLLNVSDRTVRSDWALARAWLFARLHAGERGAGD